MNAEELMIGDWVNFNTDITLFPYQIKELHHNFAMLGDNHPNVAWKRVMYDDFLPTPLTPEILEKNGFVDDGHRAYVRGDVMIFPATNKDHFTDIDYPVLSVWRAGCYRELRIRCDYVHILQHALRLCGLNDMADNFKIE